MGRPQQILRTRGGRVKGDSLRYSVLQNPDWKSVLEKGGGAKQPELGNWTRRKHEYDTGTAENIRGNDDDMMAPDNCAEG